MGILDKAKEIGDKMNESVTSFSSDEVIANTIIKAVQKQEKVNQLLKEKGCNYRVADIDLGMGIPPSVTFGVRRVGEFDEEEKEDEGAKSEVSTEQAKPSEQI